MKRIVTSFFLLVFAISIISGQKSFSFVYLPDLHLQNDSAIIAGFEKTARQVNKLRPDFVLTGGDMIYTAKNVDDKKAGQLFDLMDKELKMFKMPVHLTMGNHEHVGITAESGIDKTNAMWGKRMYEKRYGNRFYTFIYGGWKFFVLDGIRILELQKDYTQGIDSLQIEWIKKELNMTDKNVPLVISVHPPLLNPHAMTVAGWGVMSANSEQVLNLFRGYNLKLVLEGHTHLYMNLFLAGIYYISGGSTSSGTENFDDGFVLVKIRNNEIFPEFIKTRRDLPRTK